MEPTATTMPIPRDAGDDALEALLATIDVRIRTQRRYVLADDATLALDPDVVTFAYVVSGQVDTRMPGQARGRAAAGGIALSSGRRSGALIARRPSTILVSELDLVEEAAHITSLLPAVAVVPVFASREPAAAALLPHMAGGVDGDWSPRGGDSVICRMMATTVLISMIRAWAENGCAPAGWPATSSTDPFLDRVVAAIHADPGRNWTVEALASVGAMSRTVFAERFRRRFGRSPGGYVTAVRMHAAQQLLVKGHGVSAVSRELGYASDEGFSRAFRRSTGTTPSAWRATNRVAAET